MSVKHLSSNYVKDVSFDLREGEILGFSGLVGAGRTEVIKAILGFDEMTAGTVELYGNEIHIKNPSQAYAQKIGFIPESRREESLFALQSNRFNMTIRILKEFIQGVFVNRKKEEDIVDDYTEKLSIKMASRETLIQNLSGGNQQKVVIARWLATNPGILIMDEPTRGIDVGAKYEIYQIMIDLVKQGKSIIMISSEMPELIGMSNRIIVMCNGHITGEVEGEEATQERIMSFATQFDLQGKSTTESK